MHEKPALRARSVTFTALRHGQNWSRWIFSTRRLHMECIAPGPRQSCWTLTPGLAQFLPGYLHYWVPPSPILPELRTITDAKYE